jgi:hypothetical protein
MREEARNRKGYGQVRTGLQRVTVRKRKGEVGQGRGKLGDTR